MPTVARYFDSLVSGTISTPNNALGAADGTFTTDADNTSWTARYTLDDFTVPNTVLNGTQDIIFTVRKETGTGTPTLSAEFRRAGALLLTLFTNVSVTATSSQDLQTSFNPVDFSGDLNDIEVWVTGTASGGGPSARSTPQLDSFSWITSYATLPAAITDLDVTAGTIVSEFSQYVDMDWTAPDDGDGTIVGYSYRISDDAGVEWSGWFPTGSTDTNFSSVESRNVTYHVQVRASTEYGDGPESNTDSVFLPPAAAGGIKDLNGVVRPLKIFPGLGEATVKRYNGTDWITLGS